MFDPEVLAVGFTAATTLAAGGGAWGATRVRMGRTEKDIKALEDAQVEHQQRDTDQHTLIVQRLTAIETLMRRIEQKL